MTSPLSSVPDICTRVGCEPLPPKQDERAGVAVHTLHLRPLNALRHSPGRGSSGWYVWGGEVISEESTFFKPMHIAHLTDRVPELIPYLSLAPGWRVLIAVGYEEVWFDESVKNEVG